MSTQPESAADWHQRLFRKSLMKQAKLRNIRNLLVSTKGRACLDLGGDNGIISYYLREMGGSWQSADLSQKAVASIGQLVGDENVRLMEDFHLPFDDNSLDLIVIIDMLEHLHEDEGLVLECHRVLKPNGQLVANVPHVKPLSVIRGLRKLLGLTDEAHGHVRPGYTETHLYDLLKDGFDITDMQTYSRFFVELVDTAVQFAGSFLGGKGDGSEPDASKGVMIDASDFSKYKKAFKFYSLVYPVLWIGSQFDKLLFWTSGHSLIVKAHCRPWRPRRQVKLRDGRSISDATINTKIGTAAPF